MSDSEKLNTKLQVFAAVMAVVAVAVTAIFSIRAERNKALRISYSGARPLLSVQQGPTKPLEVVFRGERLSAPWLLSGRLENTGNQPIESRDIETALEVRFDAGKIVSAEIVAKRQEAISATADHEATRLTLQHGLLNPGDWVAFDLLFDGQPGARSHSVRISGIDQIQERTESSEPSRPQLSLLPMPLPVVYLALLVSSGIAIITIGLGLSFIGEGITGRWRKLTTRNETPAEQEEDRLDIQPADVTARALFHLANFSSIERQRLDDPAFFEREIGRSVQAGVLTALGLDQRSAGVSSWLPIYGRRTGTCY